jgi:hypothetical protein
MLNLIRNNFPKGCLVRFSTDLATQIEKRQRQNLPEFFSKFKREENLILDQAISLEKIIQAIGNQFLVQQDFNYACTRLKRPYTTRPKRRS